MSELARMFAGVTLLICPALPLYCMYVCRHRKGPSTDQQKTTMLASGGHSAALIVLSLIAQVLLDSAQLAEGLEWVVRFCFPLLAFLMALCNMHFALHKGAGKTSEFMRYRVLCLVLFCFATIVLGVGLINHA
jgi:hypothetical protein